MFSWFRSLRWRLQSWHALILLAVVVGFGGKLQWEMVRSHWDRVDEELLSAARILEGSMLAVPPTILEAMAKDVAAVRGPHYHPPPPPRPNNPRPRRPAEEDIPKIPPPQLVPPPSVPARDWKFPNDIDHGDVERTEQEWEATIELPSQLPEQLGRGEGSAYFVVWRADGTILKESKIPSHAPYPTIAIRNAVHRDRYARQRRGPFREVFIEGPRDTLLCVGRSAESEQNRVARMTWNIVLSGMFALSLGLFGGWWLSKRAIEPIQRMSQTAQGINANNLSDRIALAGFDTELASLGNTLNTMLDRLNQSFEQQRQFTADASHELRTPVTVLLTSSELALSKPRTAEEYRDQLQKCQRAATRMRELTDSLLTLARLDATDELEMEDVSLPALIQEAIDTIQPMADEKSIVIELQLEQLSIPAHRSMLRQSIDNLLSNAIKYNRPGNRVFVKLTQSNPSCIRLEVEDQGIGIPALAIPKLFDRFFRVDESRSRAEGGTGLGLAIAKRIIECHHGTIRVQSELDKGSTFIVDLPSSTNIPKAQFSQPEA